VLRPVAVLEHHRRIEGADQRVGGELLVAGHVHEAVRLLPEVAGQRPQHGCLRDAGKPEEQDGLTSPDGTQQQAQLRPPPDHSVSDVVRQLGAHHILAPIGRGNVSSIKHV